MPLQVIPAYQSFPLVRSCELVSFLPDLWDIIFIYLIKNGRIISIKGVLFLADYLFGSKAERREGFNITMFGLRGGGERDFEAALFGLRR